MISFSPHKVPKKALTSHTRQLAVLLESGLPLIKSLQVLADQESCRPLQKILIDIRRSVVDGASYSESISHYPQVFNILFINMTRAGEVGGVLGEVLGRLAHSMETMDRLRNKTVSAMIYPLLILSVAFILVIFLMTFIVPRFREMFADMGGELPLASQALFDASDLLLSNTIGSLPNLVWIIGGALGCLFCGRTLSHTKLANRLLPHLYRRLPVVGTLLLYAGVAHFTKTLGVLLSSGVPILKALRITQGTTTHVSLSHAVTLIHERVKTGDSLTSALQATQAFPNMVMSMVGVGEETGRLPEMLLKVSAIYEEDTENRIRTLTSIIEPLMIVGLAIIIGGIVFALFLPMVQLIQTLQM